MTSTGDKTPPHHPNYGVELRDETISALVHESVSDLAGPITISPLPHGMSYNNKIYRIHYSDRQAGSDRSLILKVNGRFFGAAKVENEVSCLLLLNHFCPDIPVPKVVAWSVDGLHVARRAGDGKLSTTQLDNPFDKERVPGWILMTLLPGSPLNAFTLSPEEKSDQSTQLASVLSSWRQNVPKSASCANLHFQPSSTGTATQSLYHSAAAMDLELHVYGFTGYGNNSCPPVTTLLEYWKTELEWHVGKLSSKAAYAVNRDPLLPLLREFLDNTLSNLPLFQANNDYEFTFTHADFAPRNILVQGSPPKLCGVVDFEFAGFSPPMEEFSQEWLPNEDDSDWPSDMYAMILSELERRGEPTPRVLSSLEWVQIKNLNLLRNYIAPWWLAEEAERQDEMARELHEARHEVEKAITVLSQWSTLDGEL